MAAGDVRGERDRPHTDRVAILEAVIDAGYPTTARLVMASIARLGFDIKDVRVLLNSEPHPDHAGGLAVLQQASGAQLWASEWSAGSLASGGDDPDGILPLRVLTWLGVVGYPPARVGHRFKGRRHDPCGTDRTHGACHRRTHARMHLMVVSRP